MKDKFKKSKKILQKHNKKCIIGLSIILLVCLGLFVNHRIQISRMTDRANEVATLEVKPETQEIIDDKKIGMLTIPDILLEDAPIRQGIELATLSKAIGHFPQTPFYEGNSVFASHNRGGKGDYFKNLHKVRIGSIIYYNSIAGTRKYEVISKTKIKENDLSCLEQSEENKLTMITCVRGQKALRLCVIAREIKEVD